MFQETSKHKINNNKNLIDSEREIKYRNLMHQLTILGAKTNIKYKINIQNNFSKVDGRPVIYSFNHFSAQDTPIACTILEKRAYILAGVQNLGLLDNIFFWLNGSIFVDRKDKEDMKFSKDAMISYLNKDIPIICFPEGTWNLSDNLLMLNMKWGIIDVALESNAQIIPVILDYDRDNMICNVKYGQPFLPEAYSNKKEAIDTLRDYMATERWLEMEKYGVLSRAECDIERLYKINNKSIEEFPKIDMDYENSIIYKPYPSKEEVFEPIKRMKIKKENSFMFYKNNKGI